LPKPKFFQLKRNLFHFLLKSCFLFCQKIFDFDFNTRTCVCQNATKRELVKYFPWKQNANCDRVNLKAFLHFFIFFEITRFWRNQLMANFVEHWIEIKKIKLKIRENISIQDLFFLLSHYVHKKLNLFAKPICETWTIFFKFFFWKIKTCTFWKIIFLKLDLVYLISYTKNCWYFFKSRKAELWQNKWNIFVTITWFWKQEHA
jgi:hypothetical protein